jgi:hypothetical protein
MRLASVIRWTTRGAAGLLLAALVDAGPATAGGGANSHVMPPNSKPYGHSYAEWSVLQWQWAFSLPADGHPLFGTADCSAGQSGKVWFLGGTFAVTDNGTGVIVGEATRDCTIPSGTALFFPVIDTEVSTIEGNGDTEAELSALAEFFIDFVVPDSLFCEIDGKAVKNLADFRVQSPPYTFGPLPDHNILEYFGLDAPEGSTSLSVSDGYFVMVKPLAVGEHTLHFGGVQDMTSIGGPVFIQDITYHITVVPAKQR